MLKTFLPQMNADKRSHKFHILIGEYLRASAV